MDTEGEDKKEERPQVRFNLPKDGNPRSPFNKRKRDWYQSKLSSIQQGGEGNENEDLNPEDFDHDLMGNDVQEHLEGLNKKLESSLNAINTKFESVLNAVKTIQSQTPSVMSDKTSGNNSQSSMPELWMNTMNSMLNAIMANNNGANQNQGGNRPHKRSRVNSALPKDSEEGTNTVDRYYYNPKGSEDWMRWFRICAKCGRWGAHFAKYCKEAQRTDFNRNEDPRSVKPVNTYPKNLQAAMVLAHSEFSKYGTKCKWNCRDANGPVINPE